MPGASVIVCMDQGAISGVDRKFESVVNRIQASIHPIAIQKLLVLAYFHHLSMVQHHYLVGVADSGKTVCDDN